MPASASMGKTVYWEPVGFSLPVHVIGDVGQVADGWMRMVPVDDAVQNHHVYAIVKSSELLHHMRQHPYVVFMEMYKAAKTSRYSVYSELMAYRQHMLMKMSRVFDKRVDEPGSDRWKDVTLTDLGLMTVYICDHWEEMGLYAHEHMYGLEKNGIDLAQYMAAWRNCMSDAIENLYMDRHDTEGNLNERAKAFIARWYQPPVQPDSPAAQAQEQLPDPPAEIQAPDELQDIEQFHAGSVEQPEMPKFAEAIIMADRDTNDELMGDRKLHNIVCMADLMFTMQFDVVESVLRQCVDLVTAELCDVVDDVVIGPNNFVNIKLRKQLADSYPLVLDDYALDTPFSVVGYIYQKLVALTECVSSTQEALQRHAHSVH